MPTLPRLYAHPFSSYSQKALIALYENDTPFEYRSLEEPEARAELAALWPMGRFPVLVEQNRTVIEASCVIEYLDLHYPGPVRLIPADAKTALEVRMLDRFFDNYVSTPQQKVVFDARRPEENRDAYGVAEAKAMLETAYAWLDRHLDGREWAAGDGFSLADCAAAPFLFYADWTHPIDRAFSNVRAYRARCWHAPRSPVRSTRLALTALISRSARPIAIEPFPARSHDHDQPAPSRPRRRVGRAQPHAPSQRK